MLNFLGTTYLSVKIKKTSADSLHLWGGEGMSMANGNEVLITCIYYI